VLFSAEDVLSATAGRALVVLGQCVVSAGGIAITVTPDRVARYRLDADLWLDHCSIASESSIVALGAWPGAQPGPDRPWLVTSHRCAFFGVYQRPSNQSVLLHVDPESFAHGSLFWQSTGDALEVPVLAAAMASPIRPGRRPDDVRQWLELWGPDHVRAVRGLRSPHGTPSTRTVARLRPGRVEPGDLVLDRRYPADSPPPSDLGADFARLGITTPNRPSRNR
jgi:serine/threonine-protein kinase